MQSLLLMRSLSRPEYRAHFAERCGRLPAGLATRLASLSRRPIWIQAVSVGEVVLARTLLMTMSAGSSGPDRSVPIVISSTTPTGRQAASSIDAPGLAGVFHFPIDWPPFVRRTLDVVNPSALITIETEIWPALLAECGRRAVPALIVNGRISEKSHRRYRRFSRLLRGSLDAIQLACMQSVEDAGRLESIGVPGGRIVVTGNMKFDAPEAPGETVRELAAAFGIVTGVTPVLVAGSTSAGEEEIVLSAFTRRGLPADLTLILAPRHRERFDEVAGILKAAGLPFARRSAPGDDRGLRVFLLDTLGELPAAYRLATVAFVGGSLVPRGGQNLIEPAVAGVPILFGPHTQNFSRIADTLLAAQAGFRVTDADDLAGRIRMLFDDPDLRHRMGAAGLALARGHRGATLRTIDHVRHHLA